MISSQVLLGNSAKLEVYWDFKLNFDLSSPNSSARSSGQGREEVASVVWFLHVIQNSFRLENTCNWVGFVYENLGSSIITSVQFMQSTMQVKFSSPNVSSWKLSVEKTISLLHLSFAHPLSVHLCLLQLSPANFWTSLSPDLHILPLASLCQHATILPRRTFISVGDS